MTPRSDIALTLQELYQEDRLNRHPHGEDARGLFTRLLDESFRQMVHLARPATVVEIGAHEAAFSIATARSLPDAKVHAFEPHPQIHARYQQAATEAGVAYHHLSVLDRPGKTQLLVPLSGKGEEWITMGSHRQKTGRKTRAYDVEAVTLDSFFDGDTGSSAVWIDVEGLAHEVIAGGPRFFTRCDLAYLEVEAEPRWDGQKTFPEVAAALAAHGLFPVARDIQRKAWQFNVIFVSERLHAVPAFRDALNRHFRLLFAV